MIEYNQKFPCQAVLTQTPDQTSAGDMTVGKVYTLRGFAGSCVECSGDTPGNTHMVWRGRFQLEKTNA